MGRIQGRVYDWKCSKDIAMFVVAMSIAVIFSSSSCVFDTKTNLCAASGRRCAPGQVCAVKQDVCIPIGGCGDGVVSPEKGEVCDDGNIMNGDNCSSDCSTDELCGNRIVDLGEDCDVGTGDSLGCDSDCTFVECGDGHANKIAGEDCDSYGEVTPDCNGPLCTKPECGDRFSNELAGEECDTGSDTLACDSDCTAPICGDGHPNPEYTIPGLDYKEECDDGNAITTDACPEGGPGGSCKKAVCGDGYEWTGVEECDDGNAITTDACPEGGPGGSCKKAVCGDGYEWADVEECDDGNAITTDACPANCKDAKCGDGHEWAGVEQCDDGNSDTTDACPANCKDARCGDEFIWQGMEDCDPPGSMCSGGQVVCKTNCKCS